MSRNSKPFKFKQFEVSHSRSSMKIGVDAVILGAWSDIGSANTILDVGCGCGVIALMAAQRNRNAKIVAIDIDEQSVLESYDNFKRSPWEDRLEAERVDFNVYCEKVLCKFDYIVSNPPYFDSGIDMPDSVRLIARHQAGLSPRIILEKGRVILADNGIIGMVVPIGQADELKTYAQELGLYPVRTLVVTGREGREPKRGFIEFCFHETKEKIGTLAIERPDGSFTPEYASLCRDFYLKF